MIGDLDDLCHLEVPPLQGGYKNTGTQFPPQLSLPSRNNRFRTASCPEMGAAA